MANNKREDRRVRRSRKLLQTALIELLLATGHQTEVRPEEDRDGIIEGEPAF